MSETAIKRAVIDAMNATGLCRVWSTPSGKVQVRGGWMYLAPEGTPDVCGFARDGRFIGIEIKAPKHKTKKDRSEKQLEMQAEIRARGGISGQVETSVHALQILLAAFKHLTPTRDTP